MPRVKYRSVCPLGRALDVFGDRWTLLVVRDLMLFGKRRFGEMLASDEHIATNILAQRLKLLLEHGIIVRERDPDDGKSYLYTLTDKGRDLAPVLLEIILWSGEHDPNTVVSRNFIRQARSRRERTIDRMKATKKGKMLPT